MRPSSSSHYLELSTTLVAPLVNDKLPSNLEIEVEVEGHKLIVALTEVSSIRTSLLRQRTTTLAPYEDVIRRAFERLLSGF